MDVVDDDDDSSQILERSFVRIVLVRPPSAVSLL